MMSSKNQLFNCTTKTSIVRLSPYDDLQVASNMGTSGSQGAENSFSLTPLFSVARRITAESATLDEEDSQLSNVCGSIKEQRSEMATTLDTLLGIQL